MQRILWSWRASGAQKSSRHNHWPGHHYPTLARPCFPLLAQRPPTFYPCTGPPNLTLRYPGQRRALGPTVLSLVSTLHFRNSMWVCSQGPDTDCHLPSPGRGGAAPSLGFCPGSAGSSSSWQDKVLGNTALPLRTQNQIQGTDVLCVHVSPAGSLSCAVGLSAGNLTHVVSVRSQTALCLPCLSRRQGNGFPSWFSWVLLPQLALREVRGGRRLGRGLGAIVLGTGQRGL